MDEWDLVGLMQTKLQVGDTIHIPTDVFTLFHCSTEFSGYAPEMQERQRQLSAGLNMDVKNCRSQTFMKN